MANFQLMPLQPTLSTSDECFIAEESLTDAGEQDTQRYNQETLKHDNSSTKSLQMLSAGASQAELWKQLWKKFAVANRSCPGVY